MIFDLDSWRSDIGAFFHAVLSLMFIADFRDFIHQVVVHRRDEADSRGGGVGFGRTPWCILIVGFRPDLVPPAPFLQCDALSYSGWFWCSF